MEREEELAILFADICGSTGVYRALGDVLAHDILAGRIETLIAVTQDLGGKLVKTLGDEVMTTFASADAAIAAAVRMQEMITGTLVSEGPQIKIRVGFHFGRVLSDGPDIFGEAVNIAARMASQAKAGQIVTTAATVARMSPQWASRTRRVETRDVRARRERVDAFEVVWEGGDVVENGDAVDSAYRRAGGQLLLFAPGGRIELGDDRPSLTVGRADGNDLVLKHSAVSRLHARFEFHDGQFLLIDQSSNGTYIVASSGTNTYLRRNRCVLSGAGTIGFGTPSMQASPVAVRYEVKTVSARAPEPVSGAG